MAKKSKNEVALQKRLVNALKGYFKDDSSCLVNLVHGGSEHGVDIEFFRNDFTGNQICFGIQVKAGDLTCKSSPNKGVKEIIGQLCIAAGKHPIMQSNHTMSFSGFYVVVEGDISETAKEYIRSSFNSHKPVYFFYGSELEKFLQMNETQDITQENI